MIAAYELEPIEYVDEQELFLSILYHDARGGNAIRMLMGEQENGEPFIRHFANRNYKKVAYTSLNYNAYVTLNTFRSYKRVADEVHNYTGIFIDLDGHDFATATQMDKAIEKTKSKLRRAFKKGEISVPTMITSTGRGLGLFYILERSIANTENAKKSIKYLDDVRAALTAKYRKLLDGPGYLSVDATVKDAARVCRLPLTYNHKADRWCHLIHIEYEDDEIKYYTLKELADNNHLFDEINAIREKMKSRKVISLEAYKLPFLTIRMEKLELLQELRRYDCKGCREYMCFVYYNAAKQIHGEYQGRQATETYNKRFKVSLGKEELEHIYNTVDNNEAPSGNYEGFYKIPDDWIVDTLEVTEEENSICLFGASKRQIERKLAKEEHAKKRAKRNQEIAEFIKANPGITYKSISASFGVSERTVRNIAAEYEIKRYKKKENTKTEAFAEANPSPEANGKNLSQSRYVVPFAGVAQASLRQSYSKLYSDVQTKRVKNKQIRGQLTMRVGPDGELVLFECS